MPIAGPFDRPIPGESLTGEPGNNPWEQPAQMSDAKEVAMYYLERLNDDEILNDFAAMIEAGATLAPIVETTYLQGVMRGSTLIRCRASCSSYPSPVLEISY